MLEHPKQLNITQSELAPPVSDYFSNLLAQRDAILERYGLTPETAGQFCDLRSTDKDRETILALYENMIYVIAHKEIPPSEVLEQERMREQDRINEFFGEDAHIDVPPLPPTITPERIKQWKEKRFELRYLPPLTLKEDDDYPGWKKKPTSMTKDNFFNNLDQIQYLKQNEENPHLANIAPNQLTGCWMLVDTRNISSNKQGKLKYEHDSGIASIIKLLVKQSVLDGEAFEGRRSRIHPSKFSSSAFWEPFYDYLNLSKDEAVIRLPRVIEQGMFEQGDVNSSTLPWEWAEEYLSPDQRFACRFSSPLWGGNKKSYVGAFADSNRDMGFRPLVVFSPA